MPAITTAGFAGSNEKRNTLFFAIDWLYKQAPNPRNITELPARAPFGEIRVDRDACTLCMACVSVCPAAALADGGDTPQLNFVEANCVQCGLCEIACPESAITRVPRFVYQREQRMQTRVLNEEPPFRCISCGTPFATQSVIKKILGKLQGHSMFQDEQALRRLQMCGDCRVKSMFEDDNNRLLQ
jgi:ferredoxin